MSTYLVTLWTFPKLGTMFHYPFRKVWELSFNVIGLMVGKVFIKELLGHFFPYIYGSQSQKSITNSFIFYFKEKENNFNITEFIAFCLLWNVATTSSNSLTSRYGLSLSKLWKVSKSYIILVLKSICGALREILCMMMWLYGRVEVIFKRSNVVILIVTHFFRARRQVRRKRLN